MHWLDKHMFTIHLKRNTGNPGFQPAGSTAAVSAVGTSKGELNGRTITETETRHFALWCHGFSQIRLKHVSEKAKGLSSLTVIWDDTCFITQHDPTVEEWSLSENRAEHKFTSAQSREANKLLAVRPSQMFLITPTVLLGDCPNRGSISKCEVCVVQHVFTCLYISRWHRHANPKTDGGPPLTWWMDVKQEQPETSVTSCNKIPQVQEQQNKWASLIFSREAPRDVPPI